ncbi:MAG TPA: NUDIX hydrolase [Caldilineaceae bacterium]|nr:NUDIX hydrolase [Caldilineaceae bacterium]
MSNVPTERQVSAGGVAYRRQGDRIEVALIAVGQKNRWQLPKGMIDEAERPAEAALREVREEAGIRTELLAPLDTVEYWYYGQRGGERIRYHKFVHFFLLRYLDGDVQEHDHEVNEARWVPIDQARALLAFAGEKRVVEQARALIGGQGDGRISPL